MYPNGEMPFAGKSMRWIWEAPGLDSEIQKMNKTIMETLKIDFESDFSGRNPIYLRLVLLVYLGQEYLISQLFTLNCRYLAC